MESAAPARSLGPRCGPWHGLAVGSCRSLCRPEWAAGGRTDASGRQSLSTFRDGDGAVPGEHRVTVNPIRRPSANGVTPGPIDWPDISLAFPDLTTPPLRVEVVAGRIKTIDLDLQGKWAMTLRGGRGSRAGLTLVERDHRRASCRDRPPVARLFTNCTRAPGCTTSCRTSSVATSATFPRIKSCGSHVSLAHEPSGANGQGGVAHAPGAGVADQRSRPSRRRRLGALAERRQPRESGGQDARGERPAMGRGQPRPATRARIKWEPYQPHLDDLAGDGHARPGTTAATTSPRSVIWPAWRPSRWATRGSG